MELYQIRHFIAVVEAADLQKPPNGLRYLSRRFRPASQSSKLNSRPDYLTAAHVVVQPRRNAFLEAGKEILQKCNTVKAEFEAMPIEGL